MRWTIDTLLLNAHDIALSRFPNARTINVQTERSYEHSQVAFKREIVDLSARPDYAVWYGEEEVSSQSHSNEGSNEFAEALPAVEEDTVMEE
jgi:hypothetical protein